VAVAIGVQITGIKGVVDMLKKMDEEQKTLTRRAINDTASHVRTLAVRSVRNDYPTLKAGYVREQYAIRKATNNNLEAIVTASGNPVSLMWFNPKQTPQGVAYRAKRGGKDFIRSAFFATMQSGHRGVFIRKYKTRKLGKDYASLPTRRVLSGAWAGMTYRPQLPILERFMPAVHMMWSPYVDEQMPLASAFLRKRIQQLIKRQAERR
jgi:hypothetical protein